jgi:hypothetical protein
MIPTKTVENLRLRYIAGLSIIAFLITSSFIAMQMVIADQRNYSNVVSLAGHQAGLVNRIAFFSGIMAISDDYAEFDMARSQVGRTLYKLRTAHEALRQGSKDLGVPKITNKNLEIIYDDPMVGLDVALERFLERAESVQKNSHSDLTINSPAYIFLVTYGPHALEPMFDAAVDEYKNIAHNAISRLENFEWIIWLATILTLFGELLLIFRPLEGHVRQALNSLHQSIDT